MKKYGIILLIVLALTVAAITVPAFATGDNATVVYVKDSGTGDGASPETAMGDLMDAINALPEDGGTVVVCGDLTLAPSNTKVYTWTAKTGKITVTGKYNGQDYKPTVSFGGEGKVIFDCASGVEFDNMHFKYVSGSSMEFWSGPSLTMGTNMKFSDNGNTIAASKNGVICFRMGNYNASCESSSLEIYSGTISYVQAGNNKASNVVGTSTITLHPNVTVTDFVQCGGTQNGRTTNSIVNINGANVGYIYAGGYGSTVTGNVTLNIKNTSLKALYAQRTSTDLHQVGGAGTITGNLNLTLDNVNIETWNIAGLNVGGEQNLTVKNASLLKTTNDLSGWDSLKLENSTVWVDAAYAGPAAFTADTKSLLIVDDTTAAIPEGAYAESKAVVTLDPSGEVNTFAAAYAKLAENGAPGGVIVLSGNLKLSYSGQNDWPTAAGPVTITSENNAMLTFENTTDSAVQLHFRSITKFCDIHLNEVNTIKEDKAIEFWAVSELTFGEGVKCTINGTTDIATTQGQFANGRLVVRLGDRSADGASGSFTMHSGALSWIHGGNNKKTVVTANIYIGKDAVIADFLQAGGTNKAVTTSNLTVEYADVYAIYLGGYGSGATTTVNASITGSDITYLYGQRDTTSVSVGSTVGTVGALNLTLDNATVETTNLTKLTVSGDAKLTYKNCDFATAYGDVSYWDSLKLENTVVYVPGSEYKGPAAVTADADSAILVDKDIYTELPTIEGVRVAFCDETHFHSLAHTPAKAPGVFSAGNNAYYYCDGCGKYFADANAETELDYNTDIYLAPLGSAGLTHHDYTDGNNFSVETIFSGTSSQGAAVYGNLLFRASARGTCSVSDLTTGETVGSFSFGSVTDSSGGATANHSNSIMFGYQKFDENDPFPLLYVCAGNSGDHITDGSTWGEDTVGSYYGHLAIERIFYDEATGTYSAETIQRVFFNDMDNIPVVEGDDLQGNKLSSMRDPETGGLYYTSGNGYDDAKGYQKIGWGWPAWFVDSDPTSDTFGKIFIFSVRYRTYSSYEGAMRSFYKLGSDWNYFLEDGTGNAYILTEVDMPALPSSEEDEAYGGNVILYPKDIKDQFTTRYTNGGTQGGTMYRGRIYYSYGFGGPATDRHNRNYINVIDVVKKDIVAEVPLCNNSITKGHEPECPAIWNGELIISMNTGVYSLGYIALDEPTTKDGVTYIECSLCGHNLKTISNTESILGDADGDGFVDAFDASQVMKYSVGAITADELNVSLLDVDGDGFVDAFDAALIQKFSVGVIDKFPIEEKTT